MSGATTSNSFQAPTDLYAAAGLQGAGPYSGPNAPYAGTSGGGMGIQGSGGMPPPVTGGPASVAAYSYAAPAAYSASSMPDDDDGDAGRFSPYGGFAPFTPAVTPYTGLPGTIQAGQGGYGAGQDDAPARSAPDVFPGIGAGFLQQIAARRQALALQDQAARDAYNPANYTFDGTATAAVQQPQDEPGVLGDVGRMFWMSALDKGADVLGNASMTARALTDDPDIVGWIERQRAAVTNYATSVAASMSKKGQAALHASLFGDGTDTPTPGQVGWARYLGATAADMLPTAALAVLPGGIAGRIAAGIAFGALGAGDAYNQINDQIDRAPVRQMMWSPVYRQVAGMPDTIVPGGTYRAPRAGSPADLNARKAVSAAVAPSLAALHFLTDGAGAALMGPASGSTLARTIIRSAARNGAVNGVQSGADNVIDQYAQLAAGTHP